MVIVLALHLTVLRMVESEYGIDLMHGPISLSMSISSFFFY